MLVNFILNTFNFIFLNLLSILIFMIICIIFELKNIFFFIILIYSSNLYQNIYYFIKIIFLIIFIYPCHSVTI